MNSEQVIQMCRMPSGSIDLDAAFRTKCTTCNHTLGRHLVLKDQPCNVDGCECEHFDYTPPKESK